LGYSYFTYQIEITSFAYDWTAGVASIAPLLWIIMAGLAVYREAFVNWSKTARQDRGRINENHT
jgi:hypothetical protein